MTEREMLIELIETGTNLASKKAVEETVRIVKENHHYNSATDKTGSISEMIADYLLENGVIAPPVKAGDTIYEINERRKGNEWIEIISERLVRGVEICAGNCLIARCGTTISVFLSYIGKTVFLTREEAEKALTERKSEHET